MAILTPRSEMPRSNLEDRNFSPSFLEDFRCPRKGLFSRGVGLKPRETSVHLVAGSAVHLAIGTFYSVRGELSHEDAKLAGISAMIEYWQEHSQELRVKDDKKNIVNLTRCISNYFEVYKNDTANFPAEYIELPVSIPMPNGTNLIIVIDRIRIEGSHACIVDTKTSGWPLSSYYFKKYENDFQTSAYYYAVLQHLGHCEAIQIDGVHLPKGTHSLKDDSVRREQFLRSPLQIEDWLNTYCYLTDFILKGFEIEDEGERTRYFRCDQTRCGDFGGCQYLPICQFGLATPEVQVLFVKD
tara:strand:- start:204 stop:1097 length:894 start_codon:yes stop_codon:yes gene_type:complete